MKTQTMQTFLSILVAIFGISNTGCENIEPEFEVDAFGSESLISIENRNGNGDPTGLFVSHSHGLNLSGNCSPEDNDITIDIFQELGDGTFPRITSTVSCSADGQWSMGYISGTGLSSQGFQEGPLLFEAIQIIDDVIVAQLQVEGLVDFTAPILSSIVVRDGTAAPDNTVGRIRDLVLHISAQFPEQNINVAVWMGSSCFSGTALVIKPLSKSSSGQTEFSEDLSLPDGTASGSYDISVALKDLAGNWSCLSETITVSLSAGQVGI